MSNEQKLREALRIAVSYIDMAVLYAFRGEEHDLIKEALELPTNDVKSVLQDALNVLGCLEYGITGVDSWPCEDSVENVVHRIRKVLEESQ